MRGFRRGFSNRHPLVLVVAALLVVPALLGIQALFVSGQWTRVPLVWALRGPGDDFIYVSWQASHNKLDPPRLPSVYLLGGSTARESIVSGPSLAADVKALGGPRIDAWNLSSINQNFAQTLVAIDNLPDATDTWVLIGIHPGRFITDRAVTTKQAEGRELVLKSDYLHQYVVDTFGRHKYDPTILPGIFAYLVSLARHDIKVFPDGVPAPRYAQHRYNLASRHSVAEKEKMVALWNHTRYPRFQKFLDLNLGVLDQLIARSRQRGLHVALVELPSNRDIIRGRFDYAIAQYRRPVERLADRYGVPYVDFNGELALPNSDFYDLSHLVEPGRVIWQHRLAEELVTLLGETPNDGSARQ